MDTYEQGIFKECAQALTRIANLMEADELRKRRFEEQDQQASVTLTDLEGNVSGPCYIEDCQHPAVVTINNQGVCSDHLDVAFRQARESFTVLRSVIAPEEEN